MVRSAGRHDLVGIDLDHARGAGVQQRVEGRRGGGVAGVKAPCKLTMWLRYYKLEIDGEIVHEIDAKSVKRVIGGTDQLAARRQALDL